MNAIIIDDERNSAEVLKILLAQNCDYINVLSIETSAEAGIDSIKKLNPDLVFLDINLPSSSGFDIVEATRDVNYEIIFCTAYEKFAIQAFKTDAVDYLLKPIDADELKKACKKALQQHETKSSSHQYDTIQSLLKKISPPNKKIPIHTNDGVLLVNAEEILRLESDSNYTNVYLKDKRKFLLSKTLKNMEDSLSGFNFCRVHNAHIINIAEVDRYIKGDGGTIILKTNDSIPVSRAYKQDLMNALGI
jgi:two-component system, LytTR family, response regulator